MNLNVKFSEEAQAFTPKFEDTMVVGDTTDHASLANRDIPDQHPISAITGLKEALANFGGGGEPYVLPVATPDILGGVKTALRNEEMTQVVGIDENGGLWTYPCEGGGSGGSALKTWAKLGEYTFAEDSPVGAITLTDLPEYTEFMIYFRNTYTTAATGGIGFYINDSEVAQVASADNSYFMAHFELKDCWHFVRTQTRTAASNAPIESGNARSDSSMASLAVKLQIRNPYNASSFKKGTVVIYGGK